MDPYISIVTLGVDDLDRAADFYRELGLPMRDREGTVVFFELGGAWLSLFPRALLAADAGVDAEGEGFSGVTLAHNVGSREEVDAVLDEALAAGADLVQHARETDWGGYSGYFADPDGHLWEVAWNPHADLTDV
jgi:catechol 2,3-dioxygenase-like lactoylglutathione lyase family enzyme